MEGSVFKEIVVVKRSGQRVSFNSNKIALAIKNAFDSLNLEYSENDINKVFGAVLKYIEENFTDRKTINVEDIQDIIEEKLKENNYNTVYEAFNSYRLRRSASREVFNKRQQHKFVKAIEKLGLQTDITTYDQPMKIMHEFSKTVSIEFAKAYLLDNKYVRAHDEGIIYIHDLHSYPLYTTSMAHLKFDYIKSANINYYLSEIYNAVTKCKKEQTGEQSINEFDKLLITPVLYTFKSIYKNNLFNYLKLEGFYEYINIEQLESIINKFSSIEIDKALFEGINFNEKIETIFNNARIDSTNELNNILFNSIKEFLKRINNIDSIINNNKISISLSFSNETISKLIRINYLRALLDIDELKNATTIYKIANIENIDEEVIDLIYNNKNITISFDKESEYFSTGERIFENINDDEYKSNGRCVISKTTIDLARIGFLNQSKELNDFYEELKNTLDFTKNQLIQRFETQVNKVKKSFPSLFMNNMLLDSDRLEENQKVRKVLKNGVLCIGLAGIRECVDLLNDNDKNKLMKDILTFINDKAKQYSTENRLNFIISQTEDIEVLKHLYTIDKSIYGIKYFKKDTYSLLNNIDEKKLSKGYHELQKLINMRINIDIDENVDKEKIRKVIKKVYENGIMFFKINRKRNED